MNILTNDLRNAVQDFLNSYDFTECKVGGISTDFFYEPETCQIFYSPLSLEKRDRVFYEQFENVRFPCSLFTVSLLHEIGHHYTQHLLTKGNWRNYRFFEKISPLLPRKFRQTVYYNLRVEELATRWAKICLDISPQIVDFDTRFLEILRDFKDRNGL